MAPAGSDHEGMPAGVGRENGSEHSMNDVHQTVATYAAIWNEPNPEQRRALIDRVFREDGTYVDPLMRGDSPAEIDAMLAAVQARFPGYELRLTTITTASGLLDL